MNNECVIGIDIGGTNIRIGRTDENDQLVDFERVSSKETFKDGNISESLNEVLKNYLDKYCKNVQVKQIAIGIPVTITASPKSSSAENAAKCSEGSTGTTEASNQLSGAASAG